MKSVKVKIFGSEFPLRGENEELTQHVANYVDEMFQSIHTKIPEQPPLTISVLAALNITEEMFKEKAEFNKLSIYIDGEFAKINEFAKNIITQND
ncbi:MAG: cell division protein ZapA [Bacteroidota bacterium]